jgi:hypothetical protein
MTNTTNSQDFSKRIEQLVAEHIAATRVAMQAAVDRAFAIALAPSASQRPTATPPTTGPSRSRRTGPRRAADEIGALGERLYEAVYRTPGETGRIRSVGTRQATRYFPMARDAQQTSA